MIARIPAVKIVGFTLYDPRCRHRQVSSPVTNILVRIDARRITDWASFHDVFAESFGLPDFYGRNMNAWIDCMSSLDAPEDTMTDVHAAPGEIVTIQLDFLDDFAIRCPEQYAALIDCAAFVNFRRIELGGSPVLALSFFRGQGDHG